MASTTNGECNLKILDRGDGTEGGFGPAPPPLPPPGNGTFDTTFDSTFS